jgi:hypothetical protein
MTIAGASHLAYRIRLSDYIVQEVLIPTAVGGGLREKRPSWLLPGEDLLMYLVEIPLVVGRKCLSCRCSTELLPVASPPWRGPDGG